MTDILTPNPPRCHSCKHLEQAKGDLKRDTKQEKISDSTWNVISQDKEGKCVAMGCFLSNICCYRQEILIILFLLYFSEILSIVNVNVPNIRSLIITKSFIFVNISDTLCLCTSLDKSGCVLWQVSLEQAQSRLTGIDDFVDHQGNTKQTSKLYFLPLEQKKYNYSFIGSISVVYIFIHLLWLGSNLNLGLFSYKWKIPCFNVYLNCWLSLLRWISPLYVVLYRL